MNLTICILSICMNIALSQLLPYTCHNKFEEATSAENFIDYCIPYILPLERALEHVRADICYSKCVPSETCLYYRFSQEAQQCVLCVRNASLIDIHSLGIASLDIEAIILNGEVIHSRMGMQHKIVNKNMVKLNCQSEVLGNPDTTMLQGSIELPADLTYLRFCYKNQGNVYGFEYDIGAGRMVVACTHDPVWQNDAIHLSNGEYIR